MLSYPGLLALHGRAIRPKSNFAGKGFIIMQMRECGGSRARSFVMRKEMARTSSQRKKNETTLFNAQIKLLPLKRNTVHQRRMLGEKNECRCFLFLFFVFFFQSRNKN